MNKIVSLEEALSHIKDGMTIMVGGFLAVGTPNKIIDALAEKGVKNLTLICNDTGYPDKGTGKMVINKQFKKIIASHIGTNPETGKQLNEKETEVQLVPQGTLAERIKCGGSGLGGFLTPVGIGTVVEEGKEKITVDGKEYLLEKPLKADVALILGSIVDEKGNVYYEKSTRNFNPMMATAAETVIVEAEKYVKAGEINPNNVVTPGLFVDYIVKEEE